MHVMRAHLSTEYFREGFQDEPHAFFYVSVSERMILACLFTVAFSKDGEANRFKHLNQGGLCQNKSARSSQGWLQ